MKDQKIVNARRKIFEGSQEDPLGEEQAGKISDEARNRKISFEEKRGKFQQEKRKTPRKIIEERKVKMTLLRALHGKKKIEERSHSTPARKIEKREGLEKGKLMLEGLQLGQACQSM